MKEVIELLNHNPSGWLATVDEQGNPRVRPLLFLMEFKGRLFWGTDRNKEVYQQLKKNPVVSFGTISADWETVRLRGEVVFVENREVKRIAMEKYEVLKQLFTSDDNPNWEVFYMEKGEATVSDFTGKPPRYFRF